MADERNQDPNAKSESDISKSQFSQQPAQPDRQQPETGEQRKTEFAQDKSPEFDEATQTDTLAKQRSDVEGASLQSPEKGEAESGFVGSEGQQDSSSELVEDQDKEGFTPEGK